MPKYRADVDGLRAVAVLAVLGFHAFPDLVPGGFIGVDVFFVVSGYLIGSIILGNLAEGRFSFAEFYARRIRRIFPALAVVMAATMALGWFALFADELRQLGKHVAGGAGFVSNFVLWGEAGYFDAAAETKPLLHLWSLGIEEQFYMAWPALLWLAWRKKLELAPLIAALAGLSFALCVWLSWQSPAAAFYSPLARLWELLLGSLLAHRAVLGQRDASQIPPLADLRSSVGIALIAFGLVAISRDSALLGAWILLPALGTGLLISAGHAAWFNRTVLARPALVGIGLISYPLYLWHWPLLSLARIVEGAPPPPGIRLAILAASFVLAWLTYQWVERPIRFGRGRSAGAVAGLCVLMLLTGSAGYELYRRDGVAAREAARVQSVNRFDIPYREGCSPLMDADTPHDWCNKGNDASSPPAVVVLGDSFGNAYAPMVAALLSGDGAPRRAFRQFGRQQCPLLLDYGPAFCREITARAFAFLKANPAVRTVVLASNWTIYHLGRTESWGTHAEAPEAFGIALERTVRALRELGKAPVVFLAPPTGSEPRACVVRPLRLTQEDHCGLSSQSARGREGRYRDDLLPRLKALSVPYFDPFAYLCDGAACRVVEGGRILSADGYHLSAYGGEFLAKKAAPELARLLGL